ncbi:Fur family transcriptional regulator [uncultured Bacteroides sp.]|uniref:Fur family transcriptional regulator n=1 Tax=uncultured Bacteroides sp. TaxID=162156 RepID=UPI0026252119|nr:Fur family transcriptional regulator [uncultured Bacteroides sp.]
MEKVVERLQEHHIKPSVQRIAIMKYLMEHHTHPTVDEIYTALSPTIPTLSKTTVYNTLKILTEEGAAQTLTIDERNTCYDADTTPHAHFLCKCCGKIYDLAYDNAIKKVGDMKMDGHEIQELHFYYKGICKQCKADQEEDMTNIIQ